jgi:hypothetical protein
MMRRGVSRISWGRSLKIRRDEKLSHDALGDALIGLLAYDGGAVDSGIHDNALKQRCFDQLHAMSEKESRFFLSRLIRDTYLTEARIEMGYGIESVQGFIRWLSDQGYDL